MIKHMFTKILLALAITAFLAGLVGSSTVLAQGSDGVTISNPAEGATVSGVVVVSGAVDFADFMKYDFFLKNGGNEIWVATGYSPVINGNILRLDTKMFADGTYQIMVRKVTSNSQYTDHIGPTFNIKNGQSSPNAYPEVESTFLYPAPGKATVRIRNCTGEGFFMDYNSPEGFKDAGKITLPPKNAAAPICPYADLALIPGEYRGTAKGEAQIKGAVYTLVVEAGKVYEMIYNGPSAGAAQVYSTEIKPDERASTDTGGLAPTDPKRAQPVTQKQPATVTKTVSGTTVVKTDASTKTTILPVSGQEAQPQTPFMIAAGILIVLMVIGGVFALNRSKSAA